jgi:hypothetical protein
LNGTNNAHGNVSTNPSLDATTYRPSASSAVKALGIDGAGAASWGFTTDRDGKTRTGNGTTGWTLGCYEVD